MRQTAIISKQIVDTPWDARAFGSNTFEILEPSEKVLQLIFSQPGHYTVKVDPFQSKELLHKYGFYYCDTLVEPYCTNNNFIEFKKEEINISYSVSLDDLLAVCHGAFQGRFHRDFNVDKNLADIRYDLWLKDLYISQSVFGLMYKNEVAGFWGISKNKIVLHALSEKYRGKGIAKYFWSLGCQELFNRGYKEIESSISVSNIFAINLYCSLGFKFKKPVDIYHIWINEYHQLE